MSKFAALTEQIKDRNSVSNGYRSAAYDFYL